MLIRTKQIEGASIHAKDGNIGHVEECYFDDQEWKIRYLVVNTGSWLLGKEVLISPHAVEGVDKEEKMISLNLTVDTIKNSPPIETDLPLSKRKQREYHTYYGFPIYPSGLMIPPLPEGEKKEDEEHMDTHLRSSHEIRGYRIEAVDGAIGHVEDYVIDDEHWIIRYMVIDTSNVFHGRKVILTPIWIKGINWAESTVTVNLTKKVIKEAPTFDPSQPISREYEEKLFDYYGTVKYWLEDKKSTSGK
jgi:hypothetical protein